MAINGKKSIDANFFFSDLIKVFEDQNQNLNDLQSISINPTNEVFSSQEKVFNLSSEEFAFVSSLINSIISNDKKLDVEENKFKLDNAEISKQHFVVNENKIISLINSFLTANGSKTNDFVKNKIEEQKPIFLTFKNDLNKISININPINIDSGNNLDEKEEILFVSKILTDSAFSKDKLIKNIFSDVDEKQTQSINITNVENKFDEQQKLDKTELTKNEQNILSEETSKILQASHNIISDSNKNLLKVKNYSENKQFQEKTELTNNEQNILEKEITNLTQAKQKLTTETNFFKVEIIKITSFENGESKIDSEYYPNKQTENKPTIIFLDENKTTKGQLSFTQPNETYDKLLQINNHKNNFKEIKTNYDSTGQIKNKLSQLNYNDNNINEIDLLNNSTNNNQLDENKVGLFTQSQNQNKFISLTELLSDLSDEEKSVFKDLNNSKEIKSVVFSKTNVIKENISEVYKSNKNEEVLNKNNSKHNLSSLLEIKNEDSLTKKVETDSSVGNNKVELTDKSENQIKENVKQTFVNTSNAQKENNVNNIITQNQKNVFEKIDFLNLKFKEEVNRENYSVENEIGEKNNQITLKPTESQNEVVKKEYVTETSDIRKTNNSVNQKDSLIKENETSDKQNNADTKLFSNDSKQLINKISDKLTDETQKINEIKNQNLHNELNKETKNEINASSNKPATNEQSKELLQTTNEKTVNQNQSVDKEEKVAQQLNQPKNKLDEEKIIAKVSTNISVKNTKNIQIEKDTVEYNNTSTELKDDKKLETITNKNENEILNTTTNKLNIKHEQENTTLKNEIIFDSKNTDIKKTENEKPIQNYSNDSDKIANHNSGEKLNTTSEKNSNENKNHSQPNNEHQKNEVNHLNGLTSNEFEKVKQTFETKTFYESTRVLKQEEIIHEFSKFIQQGEKQSISFQLTPENLGKVNLIIDLTDNIISTKIEVENEQIKQFIQSNIEQLKNNLQSNGIVLSNINISLADYSQKQNQKVYNEKKKFNSKLDKEESVEETNTPKLKKNLGYNTLEFLA
ncbi:MAG: flagellar hook-length control protein FliK [Melioribacteraceae bacterium]|nr:flagellar hook-length control protein FliK [Melioribacteraceae bacterium]